MTRVLSLLFPGLMALVTYASTSAHSAPAPTRAAPTRVAPVTKKKARAHFAAGRAHYNKARYVQAIAEFNKAYTLWKNPRILLNIAICYSELNRAVDAVRHLHRALRTASADQRAKLQTMIPAGLKAREGQVARLEVVVPDGAAEIFLDDDLAGRSPVRRVVAPGTVRVVVKLGGQVKVAKTLTLKAGETRTFVLNQWPVVAPPPKPRRSWLARHARLSIYYVGAAALVAVAATAALIATGVRTEQIQDEYYASPSLETHDRGVRFRTATNVLIGVTAAAGLAAGVLALFTDWSRPPWKKEKPTSTRIVPSAGPGGVGLSASGRF